MNILFINQSEDSLGSSSGKWNPWIMFTIEPRMVSIFWACRLISSKHMVFFCMSILRFTPYLIYHLNIGVCIVVMFDSGISTSCEVPSSIERESWHTSVSFKTNRPQTCRRSSAQCSANYIHTSSTSPTKTFDCVIVLHYVFQAFISTLSYVKGDITNTLKCYINEH